MSSRDSTTSGQKGPRIEDLKDRKEFLPKNHYFDNELVESLLYPYLEGACTDVLYRNKIMEHASELIRQIIRTHNLHSIYPGKDEASRYDLSQLAWLQIESALYKYVARPHCRSCYNPNRPKDSMLALNVIGYGPTELVSLMKSDQKVFDEVTANESTLFFDDLTKRMKTCPYCESKITRETIYYKGKSKVFNMWSQVARTVILAHIKKESRDKKNAKNYQGHLHNRHKSRVKLERFLLEAREVCKYHTEFLKVLEKLEILYDEDERPYESMVSKLVDRHGLSRKQVTGFLRVIRLRGHEFTDSPINDIPEPKLQHGKGSQEEEDEY